MQLLIPADVMKRLRRELRKAGRCEIGGLLMGEHVTTETFRVVDISVQHAGGTAVCFIRRPEEHRAQLDAFFKRTGDDYSRFNYLGEWHSHPSFEPIPSGEDLRTMQGIVDDPAVGVNFLVLMVVRLSHQGTMELSASCFQSHAYPVGIEVAGEVEARMPIFPLITHWLRQNLGLQKKNRPKERRPQ